jgi:predicted alpha-1,2-mannosidase
VVAQPAGDPDQPMALTQYVNTLIGTSVASTSGYQGNVAPGAQMPFGMVNFGTDMQRTDYNGSGGYKIGATATSGSINFFSLTHLNAPGCPGGGTVGMMPDSTARAIAASNGRPQAVGFQTANESVAPGYYSVLLNNQVKAEFTSTNRTGMARFTYPNADSGYYAIDTKLNANSNSTSTAGAVTANNVELQISDNGRVLTGKTVYPAFCTPWGTSYTSNVYFYAEFDKPLRAQAPESTVNTVTNGAAVLQYDLTDQDPTLTMRTGISWVSLENARLNLKTENATSTFDQVRTAADTAWNEKLNLVQIDQAADPSSLTSAQRNNLVKFYTALYRVFLTPTTFSDVNGDYRSIGQEKPYATSVDRAGNVRARDTKNIADDAYTRLDQTTGTVAAHYSGLSMWDTYRSAAQALTLFEPEVANDVMQSLVADAEQCGAFPHWVDGSDDSTPMAGDNALAVLAATYSFGATDFDLAAAARYVKQSAFDVTSNCNGNASLGGIAAYLQNGYMTSAQAGQPTSASIEAYQGDHAAATFLSSVPAAVLSDPAVDVTASDIAALSDRASWWKNLFNYDTGKLITRAARPDPATLGPIVSHNDPFHESTEPNYFWSFGYAWQDIIEASGGNAAVNTRLNTLFSLDDALTAIPTERQLNGGQNSQGYYQGNEVPFPAPWAYNYIGKPAATQYLIPKIMSTTFKTTRDGLPGNEDYGAESSWYVFAALGLYPVSQAEGGFALSTPQFPAMTVQWGDQKLRITTDADPATAPFIRSMTINGANQTRSWVSLETLKAGSETALDYTLRAAPTTWATTVPPKGASTTATTLEVSAGSQPFGTTAPATATAAVTFSDAVSQPGDVEFRSGSRLIGTAPLGKGGVATIEIPADTPVGAYSIRATYLAENTQRASDSTAAAVPFTVDPAAGAAELTTLRVLVGTYDQLYDSTPEAWTPESYAPFHAAMDAARALLAADVASAPEVANLCQQIPDLAADLVRRVDNSSLRLLIAIAQDVVDNAGDYLAANLPALVDGIAAAQAVLDNPDATQAELDAALAALAQAVNNVPRKADLTELQAWVTVAAGLDSSRFTPASWAPVADATADGQALLALAEVSEDAAAEAVDALEEAIGGLKLTATKQGLASAIAVAEGIVANSSLYYPASLNGLAEALAEAQAVYADANATQDEVAAAQTALVVRIAAARLRVAGGTGAGMLLTPAAAAKAALASDGVEEEVAAAQDAVLGKTGGSAKAAAKALKAAKARVKGKAKVGAKLRAVIAKVPAGATVSYRWYRSGKAIKGAKSATYTLRQADSGKRVKVKAKLKLDGQKAVVTSAKSKRVR